MIGYTGDQISLERMRVIKFLIIAFIALLTLGAFKSCSDFHIFGPSRSELKQEITQLKANIAILEKQLKEAQDINKANAQAKSDREKAAEKAEQEYKKAKDKLDEETANAKATKDAYKKKMDVINKDPNKSEAQKDKAVIEDSVDLIWDMFCGSKDELCKANSK